MEEYLFEENAPIFDKSATFQTPFEVLKTILPIVFLTGISCLFSTIVAHLLKKYVIYKYIKEILFLPDILIVVVPMILYYMPIPYENFVTIHTFVFNVIIGLGAYSLYVMSQIKNEYPTDVKSSLESKRKNYVTNIRASVNILTVIAILAVDFRPFPERYMKTRDYGFSLMDLGVGLFVVSNGLVAPEIKKSKTFLKVFADSSILLILGWLRFVLTKTFNYPFNETEYGLHWNFFMTLSFTKIFSSFIMTYFPFKKPLIISLLIFVFYETLLHNGYSEWILGKQPRDDFVSANREGIFSTIGYIGLYFASISIGKLFNTQKPTIRSLIVPLTSTSVVLFVATLILRNTLGVSRRLANTGYCVWILFVEIFIGLAFIMMELFLNYLYKSKISDDNKIYAPYIVEAVNYNGLPFFLLANLLTGLVNLHVTTLEADNESAVSIVIIYMFINCIFVAFLYGKKIKLTLSF